ncbi:hypothetical protein ACFQJC_10570 [Haloferax namakaokahaiae]|uniref:Uncharacterized protein n=1 Tax=Haloferax namakaokahaiae TaxID=1748331 RepID=A0ABD5ZFC9_9EURY
MPLVDVASSGARAERLTADTTRLPMVLFESGIRALDRFEADGGDVM